MVFLYFFVFSVMYVHKDKPIHRDSLNRWDLCRQVAYDHFKSIETSCASFHHTVVVIWNYTLKESIKECIRITSEITFSIIRNRCMRCPRCKLYNVKEDIFSTFL